MTEKWFNSWVGIGLFWFLLMSGCGVEHYLENRVSVQFDKQTIELLKEIERQKSIKN